MRYIRSAVSVAVVSSRLSSSVVFAVVAGQQAFGQSFSAVPSPGQIDPFYTQGLVISVLFVRHTPG